MRAATDLERIATLETKVATMEKALGAIDGKLDQLLDLRSKGMGAFWLASVIFGSGIVGTIAYFINWVKS